jgi:hypothetical protein
MICTALNANGGACSAQALAGSQHCFFHDVASQNSRRNAQQRGGRNNKKSVGAPHPPAQQFDLSDPKETLRALEHALNELVLHPIDTRSANTIAYICHVASRVQNVIAVAEVIARLERLQRTVKYRPAEEEVEPTTSHEATDDADKA